MTFKIEINEQDLPVLSEVATRALELLNNPNLTHQKLEDLIKRDPALTSRLLHIANSPFYATRMESRSVADAARKLGMRQLNNIITQAATGELFDSGDPVAQGLWEHAQLTAIASQTLAEALQLGGAEEAYVAGLLHDIGKIVIYRQHPVPYAELLSLASASNRPVNELEIETFKFFTHMSVGGLVVRKWHLSDIIAEATRHHHDMLRVIPREMSNAPVASAVALANVIVNVVQKTGVAPDAADLAALACSQQLNLGHDRLISLVGNVVNAVLPQKTAAA